MHPEQSLEKLVSVEGLSRLLPPESFVFLAAVIVLLWFGKLVRGWMSRAYDLDGMLTIRDNKAVAISFAGYMVALAVILFRVLATPSRDFLTGLLELGVWGLIGVALLNVSAWINQKLVLGPHGVKDIVENNNLGIGAIECGAFIGTGFVVGACVSGESSGWVDAVVGTAIFFVLGQAALVACAAVYRRVLGRGRHAPLLRDNVAAGLAQGMTLAAFGIVISHSIAQSGSIIVFVLWALVGMVSLIVVRQLVDWLILPGRRLNQEIREDRNWGVALIEGGVALSAAFLLRATF